VQICCEGFHACEYPLDVFSYYLPNESRFCAVELSGEISREDGDSKIAAAKLKVVAEIGIPGIVTAAVNWILKQIDGSKQQTVVEGNQSAATNTGDYSAATNTGDYSAATNTGDYSAATNTGNQSAATVEGKDSVAINTGWKGKAKASEGGAVCLVHRDDDGSLTHVFASKVGENGIKADTFYSLNEDGIPVEA